MSEQQDSFVTNFSLLILMMAALTVVLIIIGTVIGKLTDTGPDPMEVEAASKRIKPVSMVALTDGTMFVSSSSAPQALPQEIAAKSAAPVPVVAAVELDGEGVYNTACVTCHSIGLAGAPKLGDVGAWQSRVAQGIDVLYKHSLSGFQAMPPKGGFMNIPDNQIKLAVDYMVSAAK